MVECKAKTKSANSFSIKKAVLKKAEEEAFSQRKSMAILVFDFGDGEDYAVIKLRDLKGLLDGQE